MKVREALAMINQILDEALAKQDGEFNADTRWALAWYEDQRFQEGEFGVAETLYALQYDTLVGSWAESRRLAAKGPGDEQTGLFGADDGGAES